MNMRQEQCNPKGAFQLRCVGAPECCGIAVSEKPAVREGFDQLSGFLHLHHHLLLLLLRLTGAGRVLA